ncbi:Na+/H+ antiporter subunit G [Verrucomicrobia bacterium LW23]|nr:Na+/H+ antiporter subunit G [Verrucomicrobia bacterium LW23]
MSITITIFLLLGAFFSLVSALGVFRFTDFYARIHAATKASTFGLGFTAIAAGLALGTLSAWLKVLATIAFLFITLPIAAHLLGRSVRTREEHQKSRHG